MLLIDHLSVHFGGRTLFDDISFLLNKGEKMALAGKNGVGKTTLLKIICGIEKPSEGKVTIPRDTTIGYLPQTAVYSNTLSVIEEVKLAFEEIIKTENNIAEVSKELNNRTDFESEEYAELINVLTHENERLQMLGALNIEAEVEKTLLGLGFERKDFNRQTSEFSGGWRMRIELAKILLKRPDILLLDEPTNHLDIESIQFLEGFLSSSSSALILISHDKAFLDAVTTRTVEISLGKIYDYKVNYSKYVELRKERREQQIRAYENQQKAISDTEDFIERFRYKSSKAIQVQSRIKQLEKIDRIEIDLEDNAHLNLRFQPCMRSGNTPIEIDGLSKSYGDKLIINNLTLDIKRGEKVAFVGKNGTGKSTLVKCIMNEIDYSGTLKIGHNIKIGYFAQNQASLLDENLTVFETIDHVAVGDIRTKIRDILGAFMFGGEASDKKVKVLSGGERSRLAMIRLLLEPVNLLILDEPTNHLDISSKEVLKKALNDYEGTVIVVSHDREFLDGLVTKIFEFNHQIITPHLRTLQEFLEFKKIENLKTLEQNNLLKQKEEKDNSDSVEKINYEQRKLHNKEIKKIERQIEQTENSISSIESIIADFEAKLSEGYLANDDEFNEYNKNKKQLDEKMYEWELLNDELAKLT